MIDLVNFLKNIDKLSSVMVGDKSTQDLLTQLSAKYDPTIFMHLVTNKPFIFENIYTALLNPAPTFVVNSFYGLDVPFINSLTTRYLENLPEHIRLFDQLRSQPFPTQLNPIFNGTDLVERLLTPSPVQSGMYNFLLDTPTAVALNNLTHPFLQQANKLANAIVQYHDDKLYEMSTD